MVKKMLLTSGKNEVCGALLTNLTKAFGCISHDLFITKLYTYGSDQNALNDYLTERSRFLQMTLSVMNVAKRMMA